MSTIDCPKCGHEHEPCGSHEDDAGEQECQACGFKFNVEVEYDPSYSTSCVVHEYGASETWLDRHNKPVQCRFCIHCLHCELED